MWTVLDDEPDDAPAADEAEALPMWAVIVYENQLKLVSLLRLFSPSSLTFLIAPTKSKLPARFGLTKTSLVTYW